MKTIVLLFAFALPLGNACAQLSYLPPMGTDIGDIIHPLAGSPNAAFWQATPGLGSYRFASDSTLAYPRPGATDNVLGLNWGSHSQRLATKLASLQVTGGYIRAIFLGESARWLNDFGYSYSGIPNAHDPSTYTTFRDIQALAGTPYGVNINFGDYIDIPIALGVAEEFDFWYNCAGNEGVADVTPTQCGGLYTVFHPTNSSPFIPPGNVLVTIDPLVVMTWTITSDYSGFAYVPVNTYLIAIEDWRLDQGSDRDYNDFMFAVQLFSLQIKPDSVVPEPSTFAAMCAGFAIGLFFVRRRFQRRHYTALRLL
jgi:hypothetical protein